MNAFLHIGYPKCFSTTLQKELFGAHPDILFGGIGYGHGNIDFYNDDLNLLFESGLLYFRNGQFKDYQMRFRQVLTQFFSRAEAEAKAAAGFSFEHSLFNFSPQSVDLDVKLARLQALFGRELKLIWIVREPLSMVSSLYKEYVNMGYAHSFDHFLEWIYKFQDRSFFFDLHYHRVLENMLEYFSRENVLITQFEQYKNQGKSDLSDLFADITDFLGLSRINPAISNKNPSLSGLALAKRREVNKKIKYDFGSSHLDGIENHRRRIFFNRELNLQLTEKELFQNVLDKRKARDEAEVVSQVSSGRLELKRNSMERLMSPIDKDLKDFCSQEKGISEELFMAQRAHLLSGFDIY